MLLNIFFFTFHRFHFCSLILILNSLFDWYYYNEKIPIYVALAINNPIIIHFIESTSSSTTRGWMKHRNQSRVPGLLVALPPQIQELLTQQWIEQQATMQQQRKQSEKQATFSSSTTNWSFKVTFCLQSCLKVTLITFEILGKSHHFYCSMVFRSFLK